MPVSTDDVQLEQCLCTATTCGAGMANAAGAVIAADRPIAAIALPSTVSAGQNVVLNASASAAACNRTIAGFAWTIVTPATNPPAIVGAATSTATVIAPSAGAMTVRVTVTDSVGHTDSADVLIEPNLATTDAPATAGSGACATAVVSGPTPRATTPATPSTPAKPAKSGGGGGSIELLTLLLLGLMIMGRRRPRV